MSTLKRRNITTKSTSASDFWMRNPQALRQTLIQALRDRAADGPVMPEELAAALELPAQAQALFQSQIEQLEREGLLLPNRKGALLLTQKLDLVAGRIIGHRDGHGFLAPDDGGDDMFLAPREMTAAMHGDRALVRRIGFDRRGRPEATIVEVIERSSRPIVGRLVHERGVPLVVPEDSRIRHDIYVGGADLNGAQYGQIVAVLVTEPPQKHRAPSGKIIEVLGGIDDPGMEIEIAVRKFDVPHQFSPAAQVLADKLPDQVRSKDVAGRVDLRDVPLVTIDGVDARDFDDAVYCEPMLDSAADDDGKADGKPARNKRSRSGERSWRLLVAIADVGHYVKDGDALDRDAFERGTSVYFPRRVIPMLPEKLSNGLCSLKPDVERMAVVCDMVINSRGVVKAYQFYEAVIRSAARLTYDEVWAALSDPLSDAARKRAPLLGLMRELHQLYGVLAHARERRGAMEFETVETFMQINEAGRIEKILPRVRNDAHKIIEECMLAANTCAADFVARARHPALFRIHEGPTPERLEKLRNFLKTLGLTLDGGDNPHGTDYAKLAKQIRERIDAPLLQTMILRSMQQARYSPDNVGHFGLSYQAYAHFTSPIRRYPDLLVHRVIKSLLHGQRYQPSLASDKALLDTLPVPTKRGAPVVRHDDVDEADGTGGAQAGPWRIVGSACSATERRADEASRDVEAWLKCQYMRDRVGEQFAGRITGVASFGLFVTLEALFVEGMVHVSELGTEYFQYNEAMHELRGERTGRRFRLCDDVNVQVSRVDLEARRIEFQLVRSLGPRELARSAARERSQGPEQARRSTEAPIAAIEPVLADAPDDETAVVDEALDTLQIPDLNAILADLKLDQKRSTRSKSGTSKSGTKTMSSKAGLAPKGSGKAKPKTAAVIAARQARLAAKQKAPKADSGKKSRRS